MMTVAAQWSEVELAFTAERSYENPYREVSAWVDFTHESGRTIRRPAFWDGGDTWKVRFASPEAEGQWEWKSASQPRDDGLDGISGTLEARPSQQPEHRFLGRGFWRMGPSGRNLAHADGTPAVLVADTAWALPWRATPEQARTYAKDRQEKGFNAVLMMSIQPDMFAEGPWDRTQDEGFDRAFSDLKSGHLNELRPAYFQAMDELMAILVEHELVPVYQPVFHGYGWKGLTVAGNVVPPEEYARYCLYLVARYGARPAIWLLGGDGPGTAPGIPEAGEIVEKWDAYNQPTGLHYSPTAANNAFQDAAWLDFQWCQTGHHGQHMPERVMEMWLREPVKAVANGEPTYENIGRNGNGAGWWQGHEAWSNLVSGGTMGVVYGAGSLWNWKLHKDEPGHADWSTAPGAGWKEALAFEGSRYVGLVGKILDGLPIEGMAPAFEYAHVRGGLCIPYQLAILYCPQGGEFLLREDAPFPETVRIYDATTGKCLRKMPRPAGPRLDTGIHGKPLVVIFTEQ